MFWIVAIPADRFGVSFSGNDLDPAAVPALKLLGNHGAGIKWLRIEMRSDRIAPTPGSRDFAGYDTLITNAREQGFEPLGLLDYGSLSNSSAPATVTADPSLGAAGTELFIRQTYPPADYVAYKAYVTEVVSRYKDNIHAWQVWNEPNLAQYWRGTASEYARFLAETHAAVKAVDPEAQVVLGSLALTGSLSSFAPTDFLPRILHDPTFPAAKYFDVVDVHSYSSGSGSKAEAKQRIDYVRRELAKVGAADRPVWVTEVGYPSDPTYQNDSAYRGDARHQKDAVDRAGARAQARWLRDVLPYLLHELRVQKAFWRIDTPPAGSKDATEGVLDENLLAKPALDAYAALIGRARRVRTHHVDAPPQPRS